MNKAKPNKPTLDPLDSKKEETKDDGTPHAVQMTGTNKDVSVAAHGVSEIEFTEGLQMHNDKLGQCKDNAAMAHSKPMTNHCDKAMKNELKTHEKCETKMRDNPLNALKSTKENKQTLRNHSSRRQRRMVSS